MAQALNAQSSVLVLVDYQTRLMPAIDQAAAVLREAQWVAEVANALAVPTVRTEQMPDKLGPTVAELARFGAPPLH
ncbi:MAG: isochorismatase, partial [Burkholderiaceae bacterium]